MSGNGKRPPGPRRSLDGRFEAAAEDFEEHGHTLSAMQGRRPMYTLSGDPKRDADVLHAVQKLPLQQVHPAGPRAHRPCLHVRPLQG